MITQGYFYKKAYDKMIDYCLSLSSLPIETDVQRQLFKDSIDSAIEVLDKELAAIDFGINKIINDLITSLTNDMEDWAQIKIVDALYGSISGLLKQGSIFDRVYLRLKVYLEFSSYQQLKEMFGSNALVLILSEIIINERNNYMIRAGAEIPS